MISKDGFHLPVFKLAPLIRIEKILTNSGTGNRYCENACVVTKVDFRDFTSFLICLNFVKQTRYTFARKARKSRNQDTNHVRNNQNEMPIKAHLQFVVCLNWFVMCAVYWNGWPENSTHPIGISSCQTKQLCWTFVITNRFLGIRIFNQLAIPL